MNGKLRARIDGMFFRDCSMALAMVAALWATIIFVCYEVAPFIKDGAATSVSVIALVMLLLFNTASAFAMIRHYREDKDHIYGLDIHHLDEARARKAASRA